MPFTTGLFTIHTNTDTDIYEGFSALAWDGVTQQFDICYSKPAGPFQLSTATSTLYVSAYDNWLTHIKMFQSTNSGTTWAEIDSAHHPQTVNFGTSLTQLRWGANYNLQGVSTNTITAVYVGTDTKIWVSLFDMSNGTWGSTFTGGPTVFQDTDADTVGRVHIAASQRSNKDLIISYSAAPETISSVPYSRIGVYKLAGTAWTNLTTSLIGAGNTQHYLPFENLNCQSDRTHVFYDVLDPVSNVSSFIQSPISSLDVVGTGQTIATHTSTQHQGFIIYPSTFRSSDNTIVVPYLDFQPTSGTITIGDLWTAEGTDADSPTWTLTDQTANSAIYLGPESEANYTVMFLLVGGLDGSGNPYIFFNDPRQIPHTIAEFNKVGGTWNLNDAGVFAMRGVIDISAHILADGTTWGIVIGGRANSGVNIDGMGYLTWNPGTAPVTFVGMIWNPPNITY